MSRSMSICWVAPSAVMRNVRRQRGEQRLRLRLPVERGDRAGRRRRRATVNRAPPASIVQKAVLRSCSVRVVRWSSAAPSAMSEKMSTRLENTSARAARPYSVGREHPRDRDRRDRAGELQAHLRGEDPDESAQHARPDVVDGRSCGVCIRLDGRRLDRAPTLAGRLGRSPTGIARAVRSAVLPARREVAHVEDRHLHATPPRCAALRATGSSSARIAARRATRRGRRLPERPAQRARPVDAVDVDQPARLRARALAVRVVRLRRRARRRSSPPAATTRRRPVEVLGGGQRERHARAQALRRIAEAALLNTIASASARRVHARRSRPNVAARRLHLVPRRVVPRHLAAGRRRRPPGPRTARACARPSRLARDRVRRQEQDRRRRRPPRCRR